MHFGADKLNIADVAVCGGASGLGVQGGSRSRGEALAKCFLESLGGSEAFGQGFPSLGTCNLTEPPNQMQGMEDLQPNLVL